MKKKLLIALFVVGVLFSMLAFHATQNAETVNACSLPGCSKV